MTTGVEELMQILNHPVQASRLLYLGIPDRPTRFVVKANAYARHHVSALFFVYQCRWSATERDFERDIVPMCMHQGVPLSLESAR